MQCLHYKPVSNPISSGRGGGGNPLVEMTVNNKEENSQDFCPNYVKEFSLFISTEAVVIIHGLGFLAGSKTWCAVSVDLTCCTGAETVILALYAHAVSPCETNLLSGVSL
jgi:hypothetical protein